MKNTMFLILLVVMLILSMGLIGCSSGGVPEVTEYKLTISSNDGGSVNTPGEETFTYEEGEVIDLAATSNEYYDFAGWTGDTDTVADVNTASTTITMNGDYSITANFELEPWDYVIPLHFHCAADPIAAVVRFVYEPWAEEVGNATSPDGGKFTFNLTYGHTPYAPEDSLAGLSTDAADLGLLFCNTFHLGSIGYLPFLFPDMASCAYATYTLLATEVEDWDTSGGLGAVKILLSSPLEPVQWWGNAPIATLADLDGMKIGCHSW